jgi:hypothetical protein
LYRLVSDGLSEGVLDEVLGELLGERSWGDFGRRAQSNVLAYLRWGSSIRQFNDDFVEVEGDNQIAL